jgi:glycosyltransferase involved in cell wall biosynthesis
MKTLSVTIGIPAFNEGRYIRRMLESVLAQKEEEFRIKKIIIISDGSTDDTVAQTGLIKDSRIRVISDGKNRGFKARQNQLMTAANTDVLLFLDADEYFEDEFSLAKMMREFHQDKNVALVGGNPASVGDSFLARSLMFTKDAFTEIRYRIKDGHNLFGCMGGMLALSRKLYKHLQIPPDIWANDTFMYLTCISRGFRFRNARDAHILHTPPASVSAHIRRTIRHSQTKGDLHKYFGNLVDREAYIPKSLYLKAVTRQFIRHPFHSLFIYSLNSYARLSAKHEK